MVGRLADTILRPPERMTVTEAAHRYMRMAVPGGRSGAYDPDLAPYMKEPANLITSRDHNAVIFAGPAQSSKALAIDTPIPTPTGWKTMAEIQAGDFVYGSSGHPTRVLVAQEVVLGRPCYRVRFDDGSEIVTDADHRWTVFDTLAENVKTLTTEFMSSRVKSRPNRNRYAVTNCRPLTGSYVDLPVDPYVLGVWIANGNSACNQITTHVQDSAVADRIEAAGHVVVRRPVSGTNSMNLWVDPAIDGASRFLRQLRALGVLRERGAGKKHIPQDYLRASLEERVALLQGLMDSDGTVRKQNGACIYTTVDHELALSVRELLASLGIKSFVKKRLTMCQTGPGQDAYYISFQGYADFPVFHLQRKSRLLRDPSKGRPTYSRRRFITDITPTESVPVRCIGVNAPDHLYLAGRQMIPTHNTESLIMAPLAYNAVVDPMDAIVFCPTNAAARDFAVRRVDRMHRNSPDIGARMSPKADDDNRRDKKYRDGTILTLSWPSATEFAGRPVPRCFLTDFDRMDDDVDGEGNPFDLAIKRNTTFGTLGVTVAESSPSREIVDPRWRCTDPHEAPPTTGILALYNRGDRRLWYWPCPRCERWFTATFKQLRWDAEAKDVKAAGQSTYMECPHCTGRIDFREREEMNEWGLWLRQGEIIDSRGRRAGNPIQSSIASFWLNGTAAAFTTWGKLIETYLAAVDEHRRTMSVESLKKFYNTDMGEIFIPPSAQTLRTPEDLEARAVNVEPQTVPEAVRFLIATVDVQQNAFVVQVQGIAPGLPYDVHFIDRFTIQKSKRTDADEDILWVKPGTYLEDWDLLVEQVIKKTYPLATDPTKAMRIRITVCDSGGKDSTTANAYQFVRMLKKNDPQSAARFHLLKGEKSPRAPRTQIRFPNSQFSGSIIKAGAAGDVPVLFINSNEIKNEASGRLDATETGAGRVHIPDWLPSWFYEELCAETLDGEKWIVAKGGRQRNEAWDLLCYTIAACASSLLNVEKVDWAEPSAPWMRPQDDNPLVVNRETGATAVDESRTKRYNLADLGRTLG